MTFIYNFVYLRSFPSTEMMASPTASLFTPVARSAAIPEFRVTSFSDCYFQVDTLLVW